jgi:hypothetical protein
MGSRKCSTRRPVCGKPEIRSRSRPGETTNTSLQDVGPLNFSGFRAGQIIFPGRGTGRSSRGGTAGVNTKKQGFSPGGNPGHRASPFPDKGKACFPARAYVAPCGYTSARVGGNRAPHDRRSPDGVLP